MFHINICGISVNCVFHRTRTKFVTLLTLCFFRCKWICRNLLAGTWISSTFPWWTV